MSASITIKAVPTFRDMQGRFTKANRELLDSRREMVRELGRSLVQYARLEAPISPGGTGHFASKITFKTFVTDDSEGFSLYSPEPLTKWIVEGTRAHIIKAKHAKTLYFFWVKGPRGSGMYAYPHVHHPGTKPNPFTRRAFERWEPEAMPQLRKISAKYVSTLRGA